MVIPQDTGTITGTVLLQLQQGFIAGESPHILALEKACCKGEHIEIVLYIICVTVSYAQKTNTSQNVLLVYMMCMKSKNINHI